MSTAAPAPRGLSPREGTQLAAPSGSTVGTDEAAAAAGGGGSGGGLLGGRVQWRRLVFLCGGSCGGSYRRRI